MTAYRDTSATIVVMLAIAALGAFVLVSETNVLFVLASAAALLPIAYVVDTGTGPRGDDLRTKEGLMLVVGVVAITLATVAFAVEAGELFGVASAAAVLAVALVAANWWERRTS